MVQYLNLSPAFYGTLFTINTLLIVALEVPLNRATSHWPNAWALFAGCILFAIGFGALAFVSSVTGILVTVVLWTFGEMIFYPTGTAYVAELAPAGRSGEYMGAFSSTFSLAVIVGSWAGVALLDRFGGAVAWSVMLACGLCAAALSWSSKAPATLEDPSPARTGG